MVEKKDSLSVDRVKFLCSHSGRILPRPSDGQLKYVGGETRVVAVPRNITFSELMKKLSNLFEGDVILKYQLMPEDLDYLVSVTCDEDLQHMFDEYDRHETKFPNGGGGGGGGGGGAPRLRAFLFSSTRILLGSPHVSGTNGVDPNSLEQRYIDAINGVVRSPGSTGHGGNHYQISSFSSAGSSPKSSNFSSQANENVGEDAWYLNGHHVSFDQSNQYRNSRIQQLHRVNSSPSLVSVGVQYNHYHHHQHQPQPQPQLQYQRQNSRLGRLAPPPIITSPNETEKLQVGKSPQRYYSPTINPRNDGIGWRHMEGEQLGYRSRGHMELANTSSPHSGLISPY